MAPQFPEASRTGARMKKGDPFAGCFSKAERGRRKSGSGVKTGGSRAQQRASSVSGGWGAGGVASDDCHEVIIITDDEEGSDKVISVSGSDEEEEEPCNHRLQTVCRFKPERAYHKGKNGGDSDNMASRDFQSDDDLIGCGEVRSLGEQGEGNGVASDDGHEVIIITNNEEGSNEAILVSGSDEEEEEPCNYRLQTVRRFEPKQVSRKGKNGGDSDKMESREFQSNDDLIGCGEVLSFGEQGEGNGGSFGSEDDDYAQNVSWKNTPSVIEDPEADLSSDYLASSTENSTEADDSSDEDFVASMSENLSTDGETSLSSEEYVLGSEREENPKRRKKRKREHKGESSSFYSARKNNKKLAINCIDDPMFDVVGRKENVEDKVLWVNEWLLDDVEEEKEEEAISVDRLNAEIDRPSNDDNRNSGRMEEGGSFSVLECRGSRETEETGCRGEDDDERLQEEGKAEIELDGVNAETDVLFSNEKGKMGEMEERGHFRALEEDRLNQSREKSTSQSKVSGVDGRMEEKRYGKHVQSGSNPIIQDATSSKVEGQKERDFGMSCKSQQLQKKRKHEDCSSKKASANEIAEKDCRANWKSRTRRERTSKPWLNKFFVLADCLWGKDELLQDDIEKETAKKEKQCARDNTVKEEKKESMECGIMTKA